jgi:sn-glycerol 3-phosphate transport system permease protein
LWPLLITKNDRLRTVQIGLRQLRATSIEQVNVTLAGVVLAALPLVILLVVFQKQLVRGLTAGAVKG